MTIHYQGHGVTLHHGDCLDVLRTLPDASVDSVVTDPPYGLEFMGKDWDAPWKAEGAHWREASRLPGSHSTNPTPRPQNFGTAGKPFQDWCEQWARECLRVLKPGGHMLAFGGTRTWHRLACAVEDAGFEVRDSIAWMYGSGFPKSLDVSKAIDKAAGAQREVIGDKLDRPGYHLNGHASGTGALGHGISSTTPETRLAAALITAPATPDAERWQGWGTALKPSHEPVVWGVKPVTARDILSAIGSHLDRLEEACKPSASDAGPSSAPTPAGSPEARAATAPASAATPPEVEHARTTQTGAAGDSSAATDTSASASMGATSWSTVTSWRDCWVELCDLTSTSTTGTATSATTDLQTLSSLIASLTVTSTPDSPTPQLTESWIATAADNLFAATVLSLRSTLALSVGGSATASTPRTSRVAGGSSAAFESVVVARKPLIGTVAATVLTHGTGALNIDGCRISMSNEDRAIVNNRSGAGFGTGDTVGANQGRAAGKFTSAPAGRWPANVVLDESQAAALDEQSGETTSAIRSATTTDHTRTDSYTPDRGNGQERGHVDSGGASRFFYVAKADASERPRVNGTAHPTVKPLSLMRWLVRLVTPPGGTVLEPFAGSGTTVEACIIEGFQCIAIEREADYLPLIRQRIDRRRDPVEALRGQAADLGLFDLLGGESA